MQRGTTFTVRLPVAFTVTRALVVRAGSNFVAIPAKAIAKIFDAADADTPVRLAELIQALQGVDATGCEWTTYRGRLDPSDKDDRVRGQPGRDEGRLRKVRVVPVDPGASVPANHVLVDAGRRVEHLTGAQQHRLDGERTAGSGGGRPATTEVLGQAAERIQHVGFRLPVIRL